MKRDRPDATPDPIESILEDEERIERLAREEIIKRGEHPLPAMFLDSEPPRPAGGVSIVEVLLEERRSGR